MKTCIQCHHEKPLSEFYAHSQMRDGHLGKCKACCKALAEFRRAVLEQDAEWRAAEAERHRQKSRRYRAEGRAKPVPIEKRRATLRRHRAKYPERARARAAVARAVRAGRLIPQRCHCGKPGQAHHDDYTKPLDVRWLCPAHHAEAHIQLRTY